MVCSPLLVPPRFTKEAIEDTLILKAGSSTAIEMPFQSNPQPKVTWQYNDGKLPDPKRIKTQTIIGMTSMTMAKVIRKDSGSYKLTLKNEFGECSYSLQITVLGE